MLEKICVKKKTHRGAWVADRATFLLVTGKIRLGWYQASDQNRISVEIGWTST